MNETDPTSGGSVEGILGLGILHPDIALGEARARFDVAIGRSSRSGEVSTGRAGFTRRQGTGPSISGPA